MKQIPFYDLTPENELINQVITLLYNTKVVSAIKDKFKIYYEN
jgi:hypothetical protein